MLSTRARLQTTARQVTCSRQISLVALSLLAICAQPGCTTSAAPSPPPVLPHSAPEPVSLGGIRVRLRPPAADVFATPTIVVYLAAERAQPVWQITEQLVEIRRSGGGRWPGRIGIGKAHHGKPSTEDERGSRPGADQDPADLSPRAADRVRLHPGGVRRMRGDG